MWGSVESGEGKIASNAFEGCNSTLKFIADEVEHIQIYAAKYGFTYVRK